MAKRGLEDREVSTAFDQPTSLRLHRFEIELDFDRVCSAVMLLGDVTDLVARGEQ